MDWIVDKGLFLTVVACVAAHRRHRMKHSSFTRKKEKVFFDFFYRCKLIFCLRVHP